MNDSTVAALKSTLFLAELSDDLNENDAAEKIARWHHSEPVGACEAADDLYRYIVTTHPGWSEQRIAECSARDLAALLPTISDNQNSLAEPKADSAEKLPKSDRVWRAINYVNEYYKKVATGKANKVPQTSILSMHLDKPEKSTAVKSLARQLREYPHLIRKPADS